MKTPACHNLTVYRLQFCQFGPGRFDRPRVRCGPAVARMHAADRLRLVPPAGRQIACLPQPLDCWKPKAWPYDTPMPAGLPVIDESRAYAAPAAVKPRLPHAPAYQPWPIDALKGRHIDLYA
jgi:hypothetical protein